MCASEASTSTSASARAVCRMRLASPAMAARNSANKPPLDLDDLFLRVENFRFVFFQLRSGESLGIDQRLLALVVRRQPGADWVSKSQCSTQR